jgi:pimeloyl-ACP methyl ester carboxylesterase
VQIEHQVDARAKEQTLRDETLMVRSGPVELSTRVTGEGPLVILMHGFPELGFSFRHQLMPLAEAGYTAAAPDMRGYGRSSKPTEISEYRFDAIADDMAAIADALGHERWVSVGHDWGASIAYRTGLRFRDRTAAVVGVGVPYRPAPAEPLTDFSSAGSDDFSYLRYFQEVGIVERELEQDVRAALKQIYFLASGDAPKDEWIKPRPGDSKLLEGLAEPPPGPLSFITDEELDVYAEAFEAGGFFGPVSWYRNFVADFHEMHAYGDPRIHQPSGFICGELEVALSMFPEMLDIQREHLTDRRFETILPGTGHWTQQERPEEFNRTLIDFLAEIRPQL